MKRKFSELGTTTATSRESEEDSSDSDSSAPRRKRLKLALPTSKEATALERSKKGGLLTAKSRDSLGRVRRFEHAEGHWSVHVFIEVPATASFSNLCSAIIRDGLKTETRQTEECLVSEKIKNSTEVKSSTDPLTVEKSTEKSKEVSADAIHACAECHVSLSRTQPIATHLIDPFVAALESALRCKSKSSDYIPDSTTSALHSSAVSSATDSGFDVLLSAANVNTLSNDDNSRHFGCLPIEGCAKERTVELIATVDAVLCRFGLQQYYAEPKPHVSFAWSTSPMAFVGAAGSSEMLVQLHLSTIACKIGNRVYQFEL